MSRLDAARKAKEALEEKRRKLAEDREIDLLETEVRCEEKHGTRGSDWEMVATPDGPIVLVRGDGILHSNFQGSKLTETDMFNYVFPCVVQPDKETLKKWLSMRPGLHLRCANALAVLYGAKAADEEGKY